MSRSSPGVLRVAAILNFFAQHAGQAFTLTEVVRSLKISRATCHTLLTGLVEVGYLHRLNGKSYVVGPVLVAMARTISAQHSPLQIAQPELRALADEFDAICMVALLEGDYVVLRERAASVSNLAWSPPLGVRIPVHPEFAAISFAWAPKAQLDAWVARQQPPPNAELRARILEAMLFRREYGFSFSVVDASIQAAAVKDMGWLMRRDPEATATLVSQLDPAAQYRLAAISAPVFEAPQKIAFELVMTAITEVGRTGTVSGAEVLRIGTRLREACARIGGFLATTTTAA